MVEKLIDWVGGLIIFMVKNLLSPIYDFIDTIPDLIFGGDNAKLGYLFTDATAKSVLDTGMPVMFKFAAFIVLISAVIAGAKMSSTAINPTNRTYIIEYAKDLMIVSICIWHLDFFYNLIFDINGWVTLEFKEAINKETMAALKPGTTLTELSMEKNKGDFLFAIFGLFIEAGLMLWANFYYLMRAISIYILMLMGPLMVGMWLFPRKKEQTLYWIKEFVGAVLIQGIHATTFWLLLIFIGNAENTIIKLILLAMFIPVGEIVKSFIGLSTNATGAINRAGTMLGLGALSSVAGIIKGIREDGRSAKSGGDANKKEDKEKSEDADNPKNALGANVGTDVGSTARAERMLKPGQIGSAIGKATTGLAGMAMGAGLGPEAMAVGAEAGRKIGGVPGAMVGRATGAAAEGLVGLGKQVGKGLKAGIDEYKGLNGEKYPELTDEDIAQDLATKDFENWKANNPDSQIANRLKEAFPGASDAEIAKKVAKTNADQLGRFTNGHRENLQNMKRNQTPYGNAKDLVNAATNAFQKGYEADHKEAFMNQLPENMTAEEKNKKWNDHLDSKVQGFRNHAEQAALQAGAMPLDAKDKSGESLFNKSYVNKDAFASKLSNGLQGDPKLNGLISNAGIQKAVDGVQTQSLSNGYGSQTAKQVSNVGNLVNASTEAFKQGYAADQQAAFMNNLPATMTQAQKTEAWASHLNQKGAEFKAVAQQAAVNAGAMPLSAKDASGNSLHGQSYINKDAFASQLQQGVNNHQALGTVSKQVSGGIMSAVQDVRSHGVSNGGVINKAVYAATQAQASMAKAGNLSVKEIEQSYADATTSAADFSRNIGKMSIPTSAVGRITQQGAMVGKSLDTAFKQAVNWDGIKNVTAAYTNSAQAVRGEGGNAIQQVMGGAQAAINTTLGSSAAERHYNVTKGLSYAAGVIGGVGAYQATARMASKYNPYNGAVRAEAKEMNEIKRMVPTTTDPSGNQSVARGAVRLVTTNNKSWIEAKDSSGMTQVVSRYGSGDSSIRSGQAVYQDLNIMDGQFTPYRNGKQAASAYIQDSSGGKININRPINVNPNKLVGNQNPQPLQQRRVMNEPPLTANHKVDNGHFYMADLKTGGFSNVQMVVERDRSYIVGTAQDGTVSRISPFGNGDTRLQANQRIERKCEVKESSIVTKDEVLVTHNNDEIKRTETHMNLSEHDPHNLIPFTPNPRLMNRRNRSSEFGKYGVTGL
ncbi:MULTISPECIES: hypothetical protein [unclassified Bacillus (in: firmicutes)]|uniref:hypothetical protein n=1 Tax=unclassified Bacillus (in: firmicutes) TaxID=185979 RepID=UPI000BF27A5E|nr:MULTISPECIES: hypothetical protein [unclassified Bacillus (in: firmicutes)]PEU18734.1 hypothetical protein CN525_10120 [Bacillus sp. AFS014408]PFW61298.1 hypothetical protein COL20_18050 [Bacillus sp. AFS075034]